MNNQWYPPELLDTLNLNDLTTSRDIAGTTLLYVGVTNHAGSRNNAKISVEVSMDDINWINVLDIISGGTWTADITDYSFVRTRVDVVNGPAWTVAITLSATEETEGVNKAIINLNEDTDLGFASEVFDVQDYSTLRIRGDIVLVNTWANAVVTFYHSTDGISWVSLNKSLAGAGLVIEIDVQNIRFVLGQTTTVEGSSSSAILTGYADDTILPSSGTSSPIGSITAWAKDLTGVPILPEGWQICDGSVVNDPASPLNGTTLPDLESSFLRGGTASGATGGAATHTLTGGESGTSAHTHAAAADQFVVAPAGGFQAGGIGGVGTLVVKPNTAASVEANADDAHNNEPPYYEVVWIIRIK